MLKISSTPPLAPEQMTDLALRAGDADFLACSPKMVLMARVSASIAQRRAGAVGIDVADVGRIQLGVGQGALHGFGGAGAVFVGLRDVAAVGAGAVAEHFGKDVCPAVFGVFVFFEDQQCRRLR